MKTTSNQKRANEMLQKGLKQAIEAGILPGNVNPEITINTRAARRFGLCTKKKNGPKMQYDYVIELNHMLLEVEEKYAMETMVHEILHTVAGCMNHGPKWKGYAAVMNRKFGYNIKTTSSYFERGLEKPVGKYQVKCKECGHIYSKDRMCNLIKFTSSYRCTCKGQLEVIKGPNAQPTAAKPAAKKATTAKPKTKRSVTTKPAAKKTTTKTNKPASLGFKYTIECNSCGSQIGRKVASNAIKNIEKYRCKCGNKTLSVIQNY